MATRTRLTFLVGVVTGGVLIAVKGRNLKHADSPTGEPLPPTPVYSVKSAPKITSEPTEKALPRTLETAIERKEPVDWSPWVKFACFLAVAILLGFYALGSQPSGQQADPVGPGRTLSAVIPNADGVENLYFSIETLPQSDPPAVTTRVDISWETTVGTTLLLHATDVLVPAFDECFDAASPSELQDPAAQTFGVPNASEPGGKWYSLPLPKVTPNPDRRGPRYLCLLTNVTGFHQAPYLYLQQPGMTLLASAPTAATSLCIDSITRGAPVGFRTHGVNVPTTIPEVKKTVDLETGAVRLIRCRSSTEPGNPPTYLNLDPIYGSLISDGEMSDQEDLVFRNGVILGVAGGVAGLALDALLNGSIAFARRPKVAPVRS